MLYRKEESGPPAHGPDSRERRERRRGEVKGEDTQARCVNPTARWMGEKAKRRKAR